jgi:hypothetical protein
MKPDNWLRGPTGPRECGKTKIRIPPCWEASSDRGQPPRHRSAFRYSGRLLRRSSTGAGSSQEPLHNQHLISLVICFKVRPKLESLRRMPASYATTRRGLPWVHWQSVVERRIYRSATPRRAATSIDGATGRLGGHR